MRYRIFEDSLTTDSHPYIWDPSNNVGGFDLTVPYVATTAHSAMLDVVTEDFHRKRNQGYIINNPMLKEEIHYLYSPCRWILDGSLPGFASQIHCEYYEKHGHLSLATPSGLLPNTTAFADYFDQYQDAIDLAVSRAWADVDVSEIQILASLGELPETLGWVKSLYERAIRLIKLWRKRKDVVSVTRSLRYAFEETGSKRDSRRYSSWLKVLEHRAARAALRPKDNILKDAANLWLEFRYAIRPLIFELKSVLEALKKALIHQRYTARGKEIYMTEGKSYITVDRAAYSASHYVDMQIETKEKRSVKARAGVLYAIEDSLDALLSVWGFDQPLESLWELVPFSFIIDWFFSVGDVISSWSQSSGVTALSSWFTISVDHLVEKRSFDGQISNRGNYLWKSKVFEHGHSYWSTRRKWRVPSPVRPILPTFDLKLNLGKIIDLGAIGRGLTTGTPDVPRFIRR